MANGGTGADPLIEVLIAQLIRDGVLTGKSLANMDRRLDEGEHYEAAEILAGIRLSDAIDDPDERRAALYSIDGDGGNAVD